MDWRQIAAIWLLAVLIGGLAITAAVLYCTRDRGPRAAQRLSRRASGHADAPARPAYQSTTLACAGVGHRLCDGRQHIAPGETRPCSCWCHRRREVAARLEASQLAASRTAATAHAAIHAGIPSADVSTLVAADRAATNARLRAWYGEREERLTQSLLDAGAARWGS